MTTAQLILLDHAVALLGIASWFGTAVTAALKRHRLASGLLLAAVLVTGARLVTVAALSGRGWWFVQEKVLLGLPLVVAAAVVAVLLARPWLLARRPLTDGLPSSSLAALFTAGYAALAGVVVTFLAGYPLTWSTALIAVSCVGAGSLLTARVVTTPAVATRAGPTDSTLAPAPRRRSERSRREFIGLAAKAVTAGAGVTGVGLLFRAPDTLNTGGGAGRASAGSAATVSVGDLRGARVPAAGGTIRQQTLTARTATVRLASGRTVDAHTYNGELPGPAITATEGDLVEVTLRNTDVDDGVTLHWHGYDVPCGEDGAPGATQHAVAPGGEFVYRFRADQVGTFWYHTHQASHIGVRKGLYGALVIRPRDGQETAGPDLTLPVHTFNNTVVIGDQDRRSVHPASPGASVRLRLINTDSTPHRFTLIGAALRVAAVDGRDLHQPGEVREVALRAPAGGRYDVVLTMPDAPVAVVLDGDPGTGVLLRPADRATDPAGDDPALPDTSGWPELDLLHYGEPTPVPFDPDRADRHFSMVLDRGVALLDGRPAYAQTVNGRGHPSVADQLVAEGELIRFTVVNRSLETHPWHLHGHTILLLSRNGTRYSGSPVWVDTVDVRPGEVWEVAFRANNPGIWMNHCHNLPHQEQGMMLRLVYDGVSTPFDHASHALSPVPHTLR